MFNLIIFQSKVSYEPLFTYETESFEETKHKAGRNPSYEEMAKNHRARVN